MLKLLKYLVFVPLVTVLAVMFYLLFFVVLFFEAVFMWLTTWDWEDG